MQGTIERPGRPHLSLMKSRAFNSGQKKCNFIDIEAVAPGSAKERHLPEEAARGVANSVFNQLVHKPCTASRGWLLSGLPVGEAWGRGPMPQESCGTLPLNLR